MPPNITEDQMDAASCSVNVVLLVIKAINVQYK